MCLRPRVAVPAALCGVAALLSLLLPWMAARWVNDAVATWPSAPGAAFDSLRRAADVNRLDRAPARAL